MACTVSSFKILGVVGLVFVLPQLVLTIVSMATAFPDGPNCAYYDKKDWDNIKSAFQQMTVTVGAPLLFAGVLAMLGFACAAAGGAQNNNCFLMTASSFLGISFGILMIGSLIGGTVGAFFTSACNKYSCDKPCSAAGSGGFSQRGFFMPTYVNCGKANTCCDCNDLSHYQCRSTVDFMCTYGGVTLATIIISIFLAIFAVVVSCLGCGATCCCKASFNNEGLPPAGVQGAGVQGGVIVGQPVAGQGENNVK